MHHYCLECSKRIYDHGLCSKCGLTYKQMWKDLKEDINNMMKLAEKDEYMELWSEGVTFLEMMKKVELRSK